MIHQLVYALLGGGALVKEKIEEELKKLEDKGQISTTDAKTFLANLQTKGEDEEQRLKELLKSAIREVIDDIGLATKQDIQSLKTP